MAEAQQLQIQVYLVWMLNFIAIWPKEEKYTIGSCQALVHKKSHLYEEYIKDKCLIFPLCKMGTVVPEPGIYEDHSKS